MSARFNLVPFHREQNLVLWMVATFAILTLVSNVQPRCVFADEGMYPVSEISLLDLQSHGLEMAPGDIFNPNQICLIDGICKVNGCTGSFVSGSGLIITNHHCAFRAIQNASTAANDYLTNGFQANTKATEIPATGYTVRITESFRDVSNEVLSVVTSDMSFAERTKAITKRRKEIEKQAESNNKAIRAEVAEMFAGKTYVLFSYTYIKDVRLVFAPPASVGNFGGDVDNWEWPRHTGDFSFMRAYVAPDGSTAEYSKDNVPYQPKRFIQVAAQGVDDGDYVMLIGYPGRTARHKTASFLRYEKNVRLPYVVDLYNWQINTMEKAGQNDRSIALKHSSRSKSLANVEKRSRGQLKGLVRKKIVETRKSNEHRLQSFIDSDPTRQKRYGQLLGEIDAVYQEMTSAAEFELNFQNLRSACRMLSFAYTIYDGAMERQKPDLERETAYMERNFDLTKSRLKLAHKDLHVPTDSILLSGMIARVSNSIPTNNGQHPIARMLSKLDADSIDSAFSKTRLTDLETVELCLAKTPEQLQKMNDPILNWMIELYPHYQQLREKGKERQGKLGQLYGELVTVKQEFMNASFVPDANATLRLTFGHVRGYSPEDAVYKSPITTLGGVVDKTTGIAPFITPQRILDLHAARDFGGFAHKKLNDIPIAILYDTDTTGGNSGSPILNSKGELVGVNFDRAFEATINDFAWNKSYSRSIGVDIRYALWITGKVFGAEHLLEEMGVR